MTFKELMCVTTNATGGGYCIAGVNEVKAVERKYRGYGEVIERRGVISSGRFIDIAYDTPVGEAQVGEAFVINNPFTGADPVIIVTVPDAVLDCLNEEVIA